MTIPKSVVIVGGSIAGLLHGVYLKQHGSHVVILEQDPRSMRSSHQAGIAFGPAVKEFLQKYDRTGVQSGSPAALYTRLAYRKRESLVELHVARYNTSWGLLYRILRANFDGLASDAVSNPPKDEEGDGTAEYRAGQRVTGLEYTEKAVTVNFVGEDGTEDSLTADLVIGADGMHSTVRNLVKPGIPKEYSEYVAWRGTVSESELPPETVRYFSTHMTLDLLKGSYLVSYLIPPDSGSFAPGTRLVNWVWYYSLPSTSPQALTAVLTDTTGRTHSTTVPSGLVRPEIWHQHRDTALPTMAAPFAALLAATQDPFVTKVNDALSDKAVFCDGRVVLVGDALAGLRPHLAISVEQAARHCLGLIKVWEGEGMTVQEWAGEMVRYGEKLWLASRVLGLAFGMGSWGETLGAMWAYGVWLVKGWLGRGSKGY